MTIQAIAAAIAIMATGCFSLAEDRSALQYRDDTAALLKTKENDIRDCYARYHAANPKESAEATVVVTFDVERDTGKLDNAVLGETSSSTDPANPINACVLSAIQTLALAPPSTRNAGRGTFRWIFSPTDS
jgi:hypothetical protein